MVKGLIYVLIISFTELYQIFKKYQNRCFNPLSLSIMMTNNGKPGLNFIIHDGIDLRFIPDCWS